MSDSIFSKLSAVNVNEFKEKKGKFDYLSWTDAWAELMKHYPTATHEMLEDIHYPDGTMEVRSSVTIDGHTLKMFLPVIDHRNNAIAHPNAFDVNKNRMRCLVKNIAMHGLGIYIFQGEDFPQERKDDPSDAIRENVATIAAIKESIASGSYSAGIEAWRELDEETMRKLWVAPTKGGAFTTEERKIMQSTEFKNGETV